MTPERRAELRLHGSYDGYLTTDELDALLRADEELDALRAEIEAAPVWSAAYDNGELISVKETKEKLPMAFPKPYEYAAVRILRVKP